MPHKKDEGVSAVNQDFIRYDQVNKSHTYHLAEVEGEDQFDDEFEIRTCDIGPALSGDEAGTAQFARDLGSAMEEIGFAILEGHGVDPALYDEAEEKVIEFFTTTPLDEKLRYRAARFGSVSQGYFPIKETSDIHPDLVEGWVWCRRAFDIPQDRDTPFQPEDFWPRPEYEPFFRRLCLEHEKLILPITQACFRHLGVDPHWYDDKLTRTNFAMRPEPAGSWDTRTSTCSPFFPHQRWRDCKHGIARVTNGCV
jgi:hypothetical protein